MSVAIFFLFKSLLFRADFIYKVSYIKGLLKQREWVVRRHRFMDLFSLLYFFAAEERRKDMLYYSTQRPISPGSYPRRDDVVSLHNFDTRTYCDVIGMEAWGYIEYSRSLSEKEMKEYELVPEKTALTEAKDLINAFCKRERGEEADFSNLYKVYITDAEVDGETLQICANLERCRMDRYKNGKPFATTRYESLEELVSSELRNLDSNQLVAFRKN